MKNTLKVRWQNWDGDSVENLTLTEEIVAESIITKSGEGGFSLAYSIICDPFWKVNHFSIEVVGSKKLHLESDGLGHWSDDSGVIPKLNGSIDLDISASPFTNTFLSDA